MPYSVAIVYFIIRSLVIGIPGIIRYLVVKSLILRIYYRTMGSIFIYYSRLVIITYLVDSCPRLIGTISIYIVIPYSIVVSTIYAAIDIVIAGLKR